MSPEVDNKLRFLSQVEVFQDLSDEQLAAIAPRFNFLLLEPWQPLFAGRNAVEDFYIIQSGKVFIYGEEEAEQQDPLGPGGYFIEEAYLYGHTVKAFITSDQPTELLHIDEEEFYRLLLDFPEIKPWMARSPESQQLVKSGKFSWVGEDEIIAYVARKHEAILIFSFIGPVIISLAALTIIFTVSAANASNTIWTTGAVCSIGLALFAVLWGIWNWIDWGNDYYITTNQRVVWVEKVIWFYESRDEAPLTTILAVNTKSTLLGRTFHYGDVIVKTFTGEIIFHNLKDPQGMIKFINEYREKIQKGSERREKREIDQELRTRLGWEESEDSGVVGEEWTGKEADKGVEQKDSVRQKSFGHIFTMRFEEGDVITYRKYWPTLFGKIWLPTLLIFLAILGIGIITNLFLRGQTTAQTAEILLGLCMAFILLVLIPWWLYRYIDWRNDIYQVTDKFIIDIERKPLGTEVKKAAPLENILSLEHERAGFFGYMLNYGLVTINVGETQFVFRNVHEPARIQQDIFNRIYSQRRDKEKVDALKQRQRFVDVIEVYHENADEVEEDDYYDDYDDDFEVELGPDGYP
ncbi:MAG: cyclic nucleotide-binding domain-containing protein [Anaerolineales bacterium]|nr:cyclic nucleotide-binding domain-containing protein [Anaerolineales bacterium]